MLDFSFLTQRAGFSILQTLLPYSETAPYWWLFLIACLNTLACCVLALPLALLLGVLIAGARLSTAPVLRWFGMAYVNTFRNVPLLLWILLFYKVPLTLLPTPSHSWALFFDHVFINNRGIYVPSWTSVPVRGVFNIEQGWCLLPEFWAPALALACYTAAFMAENIRGAVLSVPQALQEAAHALGLPAALVKRRVVLPVAWRSALPALTGQMMNLVKNSSLAAAVGYPEIMQVIAGTALNQTGRAIELMLIVGAIYLLLNVLVKKLTTAMV